MDDVLDDVVDALSKVKGKKRDDDDGMIDRLRRVVRKSFRTRRGKSPTTEVHLVRIEG